MLKRDGRSLGEPGAASVFAKAGIGTLFDRAYPPCGHGAGALHGGAPDRDRERRGQRPLAFLRRLAMRLYAHGGRPTLPGGCDALR